MLNAELIQTIDTTIKDNSGKQNIWEVYEECKKTIRNCQYRGLYNIDSNKYMEAISYITDKLGV